MNEKEIKRKNIHI